MNRKEDTGAESADTADLSDEQWAESKAEVLRLFPEFAPQDTNTVMGIVRRAVRAALSHRSIEAPAHDFRGANSMAARELRSAEVASPPPEGEPK